MSNRKIIRNRRRYRRDSQRRYAHAWRLLFYKDMKNHYGEALKQMHIFIDKAGNGIIIINGNYK